MNSDTTALRVENLSFGFEKGALLLNDVSMSIKQKEFIAIIGPNGSGKTTLLKLMMGFIKPTSGRVKIFNQSPESCHSHIGYVPQVSLFDLKFPITVLDVVLMGCASQITWYGTYPHQAKQQALEALDKVKLLHLKNRPFGTLSGGQAQRVLIARALVSSPSILFLDEPTASIDIETQKTIQQLLSSLKNTITIIMVTHHLQAFAPDVSRVFCVQHQVSEFNKKDLCEHFTLGVFHSPTIQIKGDIR